MARVAVAFALDTLDRRSREGGAMACMDLVCMLVDSLKLYPSLRYTVLAWTPSPSPRLDATLLSVETESATPEAPGVMGMLVDVMLRCLRALPGQGKKLAARKKIYKGAALSVNGADAVVMYVAPLLLHLCGRPLHYAHEAYQSHASLDHSARTSLVRALADALRDLGSSWTSDASRTSPGSAQAPESMPQPKAGSSTESHSAPGEE